MSFVLITGGNGRAAKYLIRLILDHPDCPNLRVLVRPGGVEQIMQSFPRLARVPHSIVVANHMDEATLTPLFQNASMVIHNGPTIHQNEAAVAIAVIDAAKSAGVNHFLLCSVLHPMRTKLETHRVKLQVEEYLVERRMNFTIVQPAHYMQNVALGHVMRTGKIPLGYSENVNQGFIDLHDYCLVLCEIILDPQRHNMATYELVSENKTYAEVAKVLQDVMRRDVACEVIPLPDYIAMLKRGGVIQSEYAEDATERIMIYHNRWGLTGNSNVLRWLLEREPRTWREYATERVRETCGEEELQRD